jgi:RNA polymerase sigma-70 factor (ECF subfamily)
MESNFADLALSEMVTHWSIVKKAHRDEDGAAAEARRQLLERYGGAARRYLLGAVRDADAAEELFQDFAVRLMQGDLRGADPDRGRFRYYVKAVLSNMTADYFRQRRRPLQALPDDVAAAQPDSDNAADLDAEFIKSWREELLARAWQALARLEEKNAQPYYRALRFRADHPEASSATIAEALSAELGRPLTVVNIRQILHRAREFLAEHLLAEVISSLTMPTTEEIEDELLELQLLEYCRTALERRTRADFPKFSPLLEARR